MKTIKTKNIGLLFSVLLVSMLMFSVSIAGAQNYQYQNNLGKAGFMLQQESHSGVVITFSVDEFSLIEQDINGEMLKTIQLPGAYLPKDEGEPNLPGRGQYIAIPEGATAHLEIISMRTENIEDIDISPSPRLPLITDEPPLHYEKDLSIYGHDAFFPAQPVLLSPVTEVRGVDMVILGITPFQWNPVTKKLRVIKDVEVKITFDGGNGQFGDDRLRSRSWDPIISDMILNRGSLPEIVYNTFNNSRNQDFEYVIITPDNASFVAWADTLRRWRNAQGIRTGVFTLAEIGGNSVGAIESFINNAYYNWNITPSAVLLMADYGTSGDNCIVSPYWNNYCVSDNIYADVTGNDLPDVALARITAQTEAQLETMIGKMIAYESDPPTNSNFYDHPVSAGGWQSDRWFILCADICYGFWDIELDKNPVREYAGYGSGAPSSWSTNSNTQMIIDYFGPNGLGYIPATPSHLTDWGGNATRINNDLNSGAFMILHRDHGVVGGWDSPYYHSGDLSGLNENDLTFVFSINCLTGKYNMGGECFAEAFHRHDYGALGIIAASETSYSFVNDVYTWGMWDDMWPDFDPGYGDPSSTTDWIRPCFSNASGKYYLDASNWPSNPQNKTHTNNLFHHHGDAFLTVYSETPQTLSVTHDDIILPGATSFSVSATNGSLVGLSVDGNFINSGVASGGPLVLSIPDDLETGTVLTITVTKQNYFRYEGYASVIGPPPNASSPIPTNHETNTKPFATLHWNGSADYYKMYLGTDNPPTNITNGEVVNDTMYVPPYYLEFQTEYFWRVESFNDYGSSNGTIWDFTVSPPPDEDFESGDFSAHDWYFDGDAEWVIDNSTTRHGMYAARSGNIVEGQSSSLLIELEAESFFTVPIIFWKKISTLESQNTLQFIIDGNVAGEWSGESDWTEETFMVFSGWHTFEWKYTKTAASGSDDDCVWIDYIKFPPNSSTMTANAGPDDQICAGDSYTLSGDAQNYETIEWTTSGDGTYDDNTILDPVYTPGAMDIEAGSVVLTLTAYDEERESATDDMTLTIHPQPEVYAGDEGEICQGDDYVTTTATAENCDSYLWTSSGDGTFNNDTLLITVYTPGSNDLANGQVTLTIAAQGFEPCGEVSDELLLMIYEEPETPATPTGPDYVDIYYTPTSEYSTTGSVNAISYLWHLSPGEAGSISGTEEVSLVTWEPDFLGEAIVSVKGINICGEGEFSDGLVVTVDNTVGFKKLQAASCKLQVFPNPSFGISNIRYQISDIRYVKLGVFNIHGKEIRTLVDEEQAAGEYSIHFDGADLPGGIYFIKLQAGDRVETAKMVLMR